MESILTNKKHKGDALLKFTVDFAKRGCLQSYLDTLKRQERITEFDEALWYGTVDQVRLAQDGKVRFIFKTVQRSRDRLIERIDRIDSRQRVSYPSVACPMTSPSQKSGGGASE